MSSRCELADALDACEKLAQTIMSSLARYEPDRLEVYETNGRHYSRVLEFLSFLLNADVARVPLPTAPIHEALATTRVIFGSETIEYRLPTQTRFGAMLRHQGIRHADDGRHVRRAPLRAVRVRADAIVRISHQGGGPGVAAAPVQPDGERRRLRGRARPRS